MQTRERAVLLDGRGIARAIRTEVEAEARDFVGRHGVRPSLRVLLVGDEEDSVLYSQNLARWFHRVGLGCEIVRLPADASQGEVESAVQGLSTDSRVHGLLVQMPLPAHLDAYHAYCTMNPLKDVEGQHPENLGMLAAGRPRFVPSTPAAGMEILRRYEVDLRGKRAVILGRSNVVGKPLALLLMQEDATVTVAHSRSGDLASLVADADIVAAAVGRPNLVTGSMLKPGAIVLDFGINFVAGAVVGDVSFEEAVGLASMITPVPGGIGPLTNLMLAQNLLKAARLQL